MGLVGKFDISVSINVKVEGSALYQTRSPSAHGSCGGVCFCVEEGGTRNGLGVEEEEEEE